MEAVVGFHAGECVRGTVGQGAELNDHIVESLQFFGQRFDFFWSMGGGQNFLYIWGEGRFFFFNLQNMLVAV